MLGEMFDKQVSLLRRLGIDVNRFKIDRKFCEKYTKEFVLAMHSELSELLDWVNWKHWKKTKVDYNRERVEEIHMEIIDLFHFLLDLCIVWNLDAGKVLELYMKKNKENFDRQERGY